MSNGSESLPEYPGRPDYTALIKEAPLSTERIRNLYSWAYAWRTADNPDEGETDLTEMRERQRAEFDRWLAAHDREAKAEALEQAAAEIPEQMRMAELGMHDLDYTEQLPVPSRNMLNGATRFAERLMKRAAEYRSEGGTRGRSDS